MGRFFQAVHAPPNHNNKAGSAKYIKEDKIVNMNLSQLDDKDSRRVLDYVAGAIFITKADIVNVGNRIFCSVPVSKSFLNETDRESVRDYETEEEIIRRG